MFIVYTAREEDLLESFDTLLSAAEKPTLKRILDQTNLFHWAAQEGKINIIKVILKNSISVDFVPENFQKAKNLLKNF